MKLIEDYSTTEMNLKLTSIFVICLATLVNGTENQAEQSRFSEDDYVAARDRIMYPDEKVNSSNEDVYRDLQNLEKILRSLKEMDKEKKDMMTYVRILLGLQKVSQKDCNWLYYQKVKKLVQQTEASERPVDKYILHHAQRLHKYCKSILDTLFETI